MKSSTKNYLLLQCFFSFIQVEKTAEHQPVEYLCAEGGGALVQQTPQGGAGEQEVVAQHDPKVAQPAHSKGIKTH